MVRDAEGDRRDDDDGETTVSDIKEEKEKRCMQDMEKQECICLVFQNLGLAKSVGNVGISTYHLHLFL